MVVWEGCRWRGGEVIVPAGGAWLVRGGVAAVHGGRARGRKTRGRLMLLLGRGRPPSMMLGPTPRLSRWSAIHIRRMRRWSGHSLVRDARREVYRCPCRWGGGVANASPLHRVEPVIRGHHAGGPGQGGPSSVVPVVRHVRRREIGRARGVAVQGVSKVELLWTFAPHLVSESMPHPADHVRQLPMASPARPSRPARSVSHHERRGVMSQN